MPTRRRFCKNFATMPAAQSSQLPPLRVLSLESRRCNEMRSLIERHGGIATVAPSMREIPLDDNPAAFEFAEALFAKTIDVVIFFTGVGAQTLLDALCTRYDRKELVAALADCTVIVRGPKPTAVLKRWQIRIDHFVPEPNTWRDMLALLDAVCPVAGKLVAVQEYGRPNTDFYRALEARGAQLMPVPVYRWALPEDVAPLEAAVKDTVNRQFDVILFTSANQLNNVLEVAQRLGLREHWLEAAGKCFIASIGPTASETLREAGLTPQVEASPPKMGQLVMQTMQAARRTTRHE